MNDRDPDEYVAQARERIQRRTSALLLRIVVPLFLLIAPIALVGGARALYLRRPDSADSLRNDPAFWTILTVAAFAVAAIVFVVWVRRTRRSGR